MGAPRFHCVLTLLGLAIVNNLGPSVFSDKTRNVGVSGHLALKLPYSSEYTHIFGITVIDTNRQQMIKRYTSFCKIRAVSVSIFSKNIVSFCLKWFHLQKMLNIQKYYIFLGEVQNFQ
jgi:hypothetical protein